MPCRGLPGVCRDMTVILMVANHRVNDIFVITFA